MRTQELSIFYPFSKPKYKKREKVLIIMDSNEAATRPEIKKKIEQYCEVIVKPLDFDYVLSDQCSAERKTVQDFVNSLYDNRIFRQFAAMSENYEKRVLLLESSDLWRDLSDTGIQVQSFSNALFALQDGFNCRVIFSKNPTMSAFELYHLAKREQTSSRRIPVIRRKERALTLPDQQKFLLCGLPGVSTAIAERILEKYVTPIQFFSTSPREWKVRGIGKEKMRNIERVLYTPYVSIPESSNKNG